MTKAKCHQAQLAGKGIAVCLGQMPADLKTGLRARINALKTKTDERKAAKAQQSVALAEKNRQMCVEARTALCRSQGATGSKRQRNDTDGIFNAWVEAWENKKNAVLTTKQVNVA